MFGFYCDILFEFRLQQSLKRKYVWLHLLRQTLKYNLLVISVITNCKRRLAVRYESEYFGYLRYHRISMLKVLEFWVKVTYLFASIWHKWQSSLCKEHAPDPYNITSDRSVKHMLRDKGNMRRGKKYACFPRSVGSTISEAEKRGWGGGLGDFEKYTYTLYILEVHIGKKRILHKSTVQKKISRTYSGLKKKNLPEILPFPQNICFSRKFLLARRFGKIDMSLEGTCCWEMDNSGCRRGFGAQNSWYVPFVRNIPPPSSHWRVEFCPMTTPKLTYFLRVRLQNVGAPCWLGTLLLLLPGVRNR